MVEKQTDDWLDDLLREEPPHIHENGFTRRVLEELPGRTAGSGMKAFVLILSAVIGCILYMFIFPGASYLSETLVRAFMAETWLNPGLHLDSIITAVVLTAGISWFGVFLATADG